MGIRTLSENSKIPSYRIRSQRHTDSEVLEMAFVDQWLVNGTIDLSERDNPVIKLNGSLYGEEVSLEKNKTYIKNFMLSSELCSTAKLFIQKSKLSYYFFGSRNPA